MTIKPFRCDLSKKRRKGFVLLPENTEKSCIFAFMVYSICKKQHNADYVSKTVILSAKYVFFIPKLFVVIPWTTKSSRNSKSGCEDFGRC